MRRIHADLMLLLAATVWGVAFVFQKSAMDHVGPNAFIAARGFVAALALAPLAIYEWRRAGGAHVADGLLQTSLLAGGLFFIGALLQQIGLITATVTNTGFLTGLYVVLTPFIAWIWVRQRPSRTVWLAVALSFVGTWLLGGGTLDGFNRGDGFVALCAVFWAMHMTVVGYSSRYNRPVLFTTVQFAVVAVLGAIAAALTETTTLAGLRGAMPSIAFVGVLSSALTFTLLAIAIKHTSTAEATIIVSAETVIAAIAGALMLGERLSPVAICGAVLIIAAIVMVQLAAQSVPAERRPSQQPQVAPL